VGIAFQSLSGGDAENIGLVQNNCSVFVNQCTVASALVSACYKRKPPQLHMCRAAHVTSIRVLHLQRQSPHVQQSSELSSL